MFGVVLGVFRLQNLMDPVVKNVVVKVGVVKVIMVMVVVMFENVFGTPKNIRIIVDRVVDKTGKFGMIIEKIEFVGWEPPWASS